MSVKLPAVSGSSGRLIVERPPSEDNIAAWPGRIFENLELPYADAMLAFVATAQERASQPAAAANGSLAAEKRTLGRSEAQLRDARRQVRAQRQLEDAAWQAARGAHRAAAQAEQVRPKVARRSAKSRAYGAVAHAARPTPRHLGSTPTRRYSLAASSAGAAPMLVGVAGRQRLDRHLSHR